MLVIDVTNTNKYYSPSSLKHLKPSNEMDSTKWDQQRENVSIASYIPCDRDREKYNCCDRVVENDTSLSKVSKSSSLFQHEQVKHVKLYTQGHVIPNPKIVQRYKDKF